MRRLVYGFEVYLTTDDVASALIRLAASMANAQHSEAVSIPIMDGGRESSAELLLGPGATLSYRQNWHTDTEPDFSAAATMLRMHPRYPREPSQPAPNALWLTPPPYDPAIEYL